MSDQQAYDLETLLRELREIIDTARTMPMSASVLVNREETLELIDEALGVDARGAAPRPLAHQGARGVPRAGASRRRGHRRGGPGAGRAHGRAHRGGARGAPGRAAGGRPGRGRQPPAAPRGRGLHRPEARRVRGGARAHDGDGGEGPRAAPGGGRAAAHRPPRRPHRARVDVRQPRSPRSTTRTAAKPDSGRFGGCAGPSGQIGVPAILAHRPTRGRRPLLTRCFHPVPAFARPEP